MSTYYDIAKNLITANDGYLTPPLSELSLPPQPVEAPPEIGVLRWPTGASRAATFYGLVNGTQLADIRTALGSGVGGDLVLDDGVDGHDPVTAAMTMVAAPVIHDCGGSDVSKNLYLLVLADARYWYRYRTGSISSPPASWSGLFSSLGTLLGVTVTTDSIDADYQTPSQRWQQFQQPLPSLLDAAAAAVGHRVVVALDGTVTTVRYSTAQAAAEAQYDADGFRVTVGGRQALEDLTRSVPASVDTVFALTHAGVPQTSPYTVNTALASLSLTEYDGATGRSGYKATVYADYVYTAKSASATARNAVAIQAATDWYLWQLCDLDFTAPGIVAWSPTGVEDAVEWRYQYGGRLLTRVVRGPYQVQPLGGVGLPPQKPVVRVTARTGAFGEFEYTYSVRQVEIDATGAVEDFTSVDSGTQNWTGVVELCDRKLTASAGADPDEDLYTLHYTGDLDYHGAATGVFYIEADHSAGCGLTENEDGEFVFDAATVAGTGLSAEGTCSLRVDAGYLPGDVTIFGCGLTFDGVSDLDLDLSSVVVAPLTWSGCSLGIDYGCGLTVDSGDLVVDPVALAADRAATALVIKPTESICAIGVDLATDTTTTEALDRIDGFGLVNGMLRLSYTRFNFINEFNEAGLYINRYVDSSTASYIELDPCLLEDCCSASALVATASADDETPAVGQSVNFTGGASGGLSPYYYSWTFGDGGTSSSQNPSHTYASPGTYTATLTVTDSCGRTATDEVTVTVATNTEPSCFGGELPDDLYVTLSGGTDGCAAANGVQVRIARTSPTIWEFAELLEGEGDCASTVTVVVFNCETGVLLWVWGGDNNANPVLQSFSTSRPLVAAYLMTPTFATVEDCCSGGDTITATITESP